LVHSTQRQKHNQVPNEITASVLAERATKIFLASSRATSQHEQCATYATENTQDKQSSIKNHWRKYGWTCHKAQKPLSTNTQSLLDFCWETKSAEKSISQLKARFTKHNVSIQR
jgi:hypothetical protein